MATFSDLLLLLRADTSDIDRKLKSTRAELNQFVRETTSLGSSLTTLGGQMTAGISVPLAGIGISAGKMAADFELGLRKVGSLVGGFSDTEIAGLSARVLEMSKALGVDAVKSTEALYQAISAGVPKDNAIDFLAVASKAAIAGITDTKIAVDGLTSIINAYGLSTKDAREVSDAMFESVNRGKFEFKDLAASISIAIPLASSLGIGFKDVLAAAATLTSQGFSVSEAMTSIRAAMVAIIAPNTQMNASSRRWA